MREIVHIQAGQCGNQIGAKVGILEFEFVGTHFFKSEALTTYITCELIFKNRYGVTYSKWGFYQYLFKNSTHFAKM